MERIEDAEPINFGSNQLISIQKLAEKIAEIFGKRMRIEHDQTGLQGTHKHCADLTKMKQKSTVQKERARNPHTSLCRSLPGQIPFSSLYNYMHSSKVEIWEPSTDNELSRYTWFGSNRLREIRPTGATTGRCRDSGR